MKEMESNFHFGPARSGEQTVYGARTPDASPTNIFEWADFMRAQSVTRVCCLLDAGQLADLVSRLPSQDAVEILATVPAERAGRALALSHPHVRSRFQRLSTTDLPAPPRWSRLRGWDRHRGPTAESGPSDP